MSSAAIGWEINRPTPTTNRTASLAQLAVVDYVAGFIAMLAPNAKLTSGRHSAHHLPALTADQLVSFYWTVIGLSGDSCRPNRLDDEATWNCRLPNDVGRRPASCRQLISINIRWKSFRRTAAASKNVVILYVQRLQQGSRWRNASRE